VCPSDLEIIGDAPRVTGAGVRQRVLSFGSWLEPQAAQDMERSVDALNSTRLTWEFILVNDGSNQDCSELLATYSMKDKKIKIINFTRNFGHQAALTAGLQTAKGESIILMDGDLQDPPEIIPEMVETWRKGYDIVIALRRSRQEKFIRSFCFKVFHTIINFLTDFKIQANAGIFGLISKRAAQELLRFNEANRFIPGLRSYIGFETAFVNYDRLERLAGKPKQTFVKLIKYGLDAVFSFSYKPLRITFLLGLIMFFLSSGYAFIIFIKRLLNIDVVKGFTTIAIAIMILGGIQLISIGILGEYMGRIYDEVKKRPMFIIKDTINI
jgi:dolichol-phosphate mannosyltransferase